MVTRLSRVVLLLAGIVKLTVVDRAKTESGALEVGGLELANGAGVRCAKLGGLGG